MKNKILMGSIITFVFLLMTNVVNSNTNESKDESIRDKFFVFGFYPDIYRNWYFYYIIPRILYRGVPEYALLRYNIYYFHGSFIIIGISNERPTIGIGKIPY